MGRGAREAIYSRVRGPHCRFLSVEGSLFGPLWRAEERLSCRSEVLEVTVGGTYTALQELSAVSTL